MALLAIEPDDEGEWSFTHPISLWDHLRIAMVREFPEWIDTGRSTGKRFMQLGPGRKFIDDPQTDWFNIDYPDWDAEIDPLPAHEATIDGIITYHMLDHISDPRAVLAEAGRVLVDGGWWVSIVPHYLGELAHSCFDHKSQFAVDSWRNALDNKHDPTQGPLPFRLGANFIYGLNEANLVLVTQMWRNHR
jgi:SAM-dependent methyltransferase